MFRLLGVGQVRALLEEHLLAARDAVTQDLLFGWHEQVIVPGKKQSRDADLSEARGDIPIFEVASDVQLTCPYMN